MISSVPVSGREASEPTVARLTLVLIAVLAVVAAYAVLPRLLGEWQRNPAGEHAAIVFLVAVIMSYRAWRRQMPATVSPHRSFILPAALLFLTSLLCVFADAFLEEEFLLAAGIWVGLPAMVYWWAGGDGWRRLAFPWLLLGFCLPLPHYVAFYYVIFPLQQLAAIWTSGMLANFGHNAWHAGTMVHISSASLQIVEECSGVRFLTTLTFMALLVGHLRLRRFMPLRFMVLLLAVPLAILVNVLRLTIAGQIMSWHGAAAALAFIHSNYILLFYFAAIVLLLAGVKLLEKVARSVTRSALAMPAVGADQPPVATVHPVNRFAPMLTIFWLVMLISGSLLATRPMAQDFNRPGLDAVPLCPVGWQTVDGRGDAPLEPYITALAAAPHHGRKWLCAPGGGSVSIEIVWWPGRRPRNRLIVFHQSVICSAGRYADAQHAQQLLSGEAVATTLVNNPAAPVRLYYWLQSSGRVSVEPFKHALWQYWLELSGRPADGCFVLIAVPAANAVSAAELVDLLRHVRSGLEKWFT